jgi:hypothetical protein
METGFFTVLLTLLFLYAAITWRLLIAFKYKEQEGRLAMKVLILGAHCR